MTSIDKIMFEICLGNSSQEYKDLMCIQAKFKGIIKDLLPFWQVFIRQIRY